MTVVVGAAVVMLVVAACLVLWRMVHGPSPLDRIVAADVMVAIVIAGVGIYTVAARNSTGLPILLVLSLVGFSGAVGVARLISSPSTIRRRFDRRRARQEDNGDD
ncbi:MAG: monovalent cation/H+ antiporter complex subunit F [Propionicimonas sp.]|nr:monovalent cation/H+ antiporter complex subunit F [Propionicimonas sp.]